MKLRLLTGHVRDLKLSWLKVTIDDLGVLLQIRPKLSEFVKYRTSLDSFSTPGVALEQD